MRPLLIILTIILVMYLLKIFVIDGNDHDKPLAVKTSQSDNNNRLPVDIYVAEEIEQANTVYSTGTIIPNEEVEIKSEVSGRIIKLNLNEGAYVKKEQLIAKIDDQDLQAQLKRLQYEEALADQTEKRQKKLLEIDAISKEEYDMAMNKVNTLSADKELLEVQIEKTEVRAPFSGYMGLKYISQGAYVTPGTGIANLVQTNPAKLDFTLPEKYANKIKVGQDIIFTIDGEDEAKKGKVIAIDPKIDENLRTLRVRAKAPNPSNKLLPGMFVRVEVPFGADKSIMIPSESIIPILKGKKVFVLRGGKAEETIVKTGLRTDTKVEIEEGLQIGDSVIVSSLMSIKPDIPVRVRDLMY